MKSTRESVGAPTSQRCNPSCSPCTCSEPPPLSCSAWRSLNDLQISLIFQGPKPFRVLPGRMVGRVLTLFLCFFFCYPPVDHRCTRKTTEESLCDKADSLCVSEWCIQTSELLWGMQLHTDTHLNTFYSFIRPSLSNSTNPIVTLTHTHFGICRRWYMWCFERFVCVMLDGSHSWSLLPLLHRTTFCQASHPSLQLWFMYTQQVMLVLCPDLMQGSWLSICIRRKPPL